MSRDYDLGLFEVQGSSGLDSFFAREPEIVTPRSRRKIASIQDLSAFVRIGADQLVHKADRDLWAIKRDAQGTLSIERQFDDNGQPLRF